MGSYFKASLAGAVALGYIGVDQLMFSNHTAAPSKLEGAIIEAAKPKGAGIERVALRSDSSGYLPVAQMQFSPLKYNVAAVKANNGYWFTVLADVKPNNSQYQISVNGVSHKVDRTNVCIDYSSGAAILRLSNPDGHQMPIKTAKAMKGAAVVVHEPANAEVNRFFGTVKYLGQYTIQDGNKEWSVPKGLEVDIEAKGIRPGAAAYVLDAKSNAPMLTGLLMTKRGHESAFVISIDLFKELASKCAIDPF